MRKFYEVPAVELQKLAVEDVITTSQTTGPVENSTGDDEF